MKPPNLANQREDSQRYTAKKAFFDNLITLYGRKPCGEVLLDPSCKIYRLHLAQSNRKSDVIAQLVKLATQRDIEICFHTRSQLSRISRNSKQDQGVACDIECSGYQHYSEAVKQLSSQASTRLIALDGVTNPQNLGMIIRSVTASPAHALLLPARGCADISPLVIKASAGTIFKANILRCDDLASALTTFKQQGFQVAVLDARADLSITEFIPTKATIFVLGNETQGTSAQVDQLADHRLSITMQRGVESLNVAVAAALVSFMPL